MKRTKKNVGEPIKGCVKRVSEKYKFIYFAIAKTGSSSIKKILKDEFGIKTDARIAKNKLKDYSDYFKFAFVRNPWDRILSCYLGKIKKDQSPVNENYTNGVANIFLKYEGFYAGMPFEEFVEKIAKIPDIDADAHFQSQYCSICDKNENFIVHFIGRFENLQGDFDKVMSKIGLDKIVLPKVNSTKRKEHYSNYYNEKTKNLIAERYKEDIRIFNYSFEDEPLKEKTKDIKNIPFVERVFRSVVNYKKKYVSKRILSEVVSEYFEKLFFKIKKRRAEKKKESERKMKVKDMPGIRM